MEMTIETMEINIAISAIRFDFLYSFIASLCRSISLASGELFGMNPFGILHPFV